MNERDYKEILERVLKLNVIDDILFHKMAESQSFCQELISTILGEHVTVLQTIPQNYIRNLQGRSVIVDALCRLPNQRICNVEVQKANDDNHQKRVRYNASCITANITDPGVHFQEVPDVCMIYISRFDIFQAGLTIYHIDRAIHETGEIVYNGLQEIYVSASINDGSAIAELMKIFTQVNYYNYEAFPITSNRKNQLKIVRRDKKSCVISLRNMRKKELRKPKKLRQRKLLKKALENMPRTFLSMVRTFHLFEKA